ncbi:hypothetical protein EB796_020298 [Bugula neritina]|uniref:Uncharacterized protein n=1 Tax=Bugula neritina TaxID=10212 RepID=A0A7J7J778_BUGNE|nr:hypothetical protein EB796_020298 [Bugula neritina]
MRFLFNGTIFKTLYLNQFAVFFLEKLETNGKANVTFEFLSDYPECIYTDSKLLFRQGTTRGVGRVTSIVTLPSTSEPKCDSKEEGVSNDGSMSSDSSMSSSRTSVGDSNSSKCVPIGEENSNDNSMSSDSSDSSFGTSDGDSNSSDDSNSGNTSGFKVCRDESFYGASCTGNQGTLQFAGC